MSDLTPAECPNVRPDTSVKKDVKIRAHQAPDIDDAEQRLTL